MKKLLLLLLMTGVLAARSQSLLKPGFSGKEYRSLLEMFSRFPDSLKPSYPIPAPAGYHRVFSSGEVGLRNRWDLWLHNNEKIAAIIVRGTVQHSESWLENFYAGMIPANGSLHLNDSLNFDYHFAKDSRAMVHVGWTLGTGYMMPTITAQIRKAYDQGYHEFYLFGHSQGGALCYLIRSQLAYLQSSGALPKDIYFKTYCSAAPKPGNTAFAYEYEALTRDGWGFNVVNGADWVPETPFSVQRLEDFNPVNPFVNVGPALSKSPWLVRLVLKSKFNKMNKATRKAARKMQKYLGKMAGGQVAKLLKQYKQPEYAPYNNYQRTGTIIMLLPDESYFQTYPNTDPSKVFIHHLLEPYFDLSLKYYP